MNAGDPLRIDRLDGLDNTGLEGRGQRMFLALGVAQSQRAVAGQFEIVGTVRLVFQFQDDRLAVDRRLHRPGDRQPFLARPRAVGVGRLQPIDLARGDAGQREVDRGDALFDRQIFHLATLRITGRRRRRSVGAVLGVCSAPNQQGNLADFLQGVDQLQVDQRLGVLSLLVRMPHRDLLHAARQHCADGFARDGEIDLGLRDDGNRHADNLPLGVDHRPARVARVHAAVDLDALQDARFVAPKA